MSDDQKKSSEIAFVVSKTALGVFMGFSTIVFTSLIGWAASWAGNQTEAVKDLTTKQAVILSKLQDSANWNNGLIGRVDRLEDRIINLERKDTP